MQQSYENSFRNLCRCSEIVEAGIGSVSKGTVLDYMHARMEQDGVCAATVNKDIAFLKRMLSRAVEWDLADHNPLQGMRLFPASQKRDVHLSVPQARDLIGALPEPIANIVEFALCTGFRKENILGLKIEDARLYDLPPRGEVVLIVKGGRRELFPLGPGALDVIRRAIGDREEGYVFINPQTGTRYTCIHKKFNEVVVELGLTAADGTKLRFHDLRHVFATWLHREGVSLDSLRFLLGHLHRTTTDRYTTVDRIALGDVLSDRVHIFL